MDLQLKIEHIEGANDVFVITTLSNLLSVFFIFKHFATFIALSSIHRRYQHQPLNQRIKNEQKNIHRLLIM